MKHFLLSVFILQTLISCGQASKNTDEPQIAQGIIVQNGSECPYIDQPRYIINDNSVIYEDCHNRAYLDADAKSIRIPKYDLGGIFAIDKNGVYVKGQFAKTDTTGFKYVGRSPINILWKTATKLYKDTTEVTGADVATFTAVECSNGYYYKDKYSIFYFDKKIEGSDGASVVSESCNNFCYDKNNVYIDGKIAYHKGERLLPVTTLLVKTKSTVYLRNGMKPVAGADVATLKKLSDRYFSIDKKHVYYEDKPTPILPKDFKNVKVWDQVNSAYVTDGKKIYYRDYETVKGIDAGSFGMIPHSDYFFDKNGIYQRHYNEKEVMEYPKFPFTYSVPVTAATATRGDRSAYIAYADQAYDLGNDEVFKNLSPEQITLINANKLSLSKTGNAGDNRINFDYKLFRSGDAIYWDGKNTRADAATFTRVGDYHFKDKNKVYTYSREEGIIALPDIDAATATAFNGFLRDKNFIYSGKTKVISGKGIEMLAVFAGYRKGCGMDNQPGSDYYLFRNDDGYWLVMVSNTVRIRNLGSTPGNDWNKNVPDFEIR